MARKSQRNKGSKKSKRKPAKAVSLTNNQSPRPIVVPKARKSAPSKSIRPHHVSAVCAVTNPFCPAAKNSKWPDGTMGNTLTEQFRGIYTPLVNASGAGMTIFSPGAPYGYAGGVLVGTDATIGAYATYRASSMLETYGNTYRVVSFGVIIRCAASATACGGMVTLGTGTPPPQGTVITMGQQLYQETTVKAIQPGMELSWISVPGGTGARDFVAQSTSTGPLLDWTALYIEVAGAAVSTAPLSFEWFLNVEFTPKLTARALTAVAKPNPSKSIHAETATSTVHKTLGSFIEGGVAVVEDSIAKHASKALNAIFDDPLGTLAALFG
jgi:hypothetical protein